MEEKKKRLVVKIGDLFCAEIDNEYKMYFQYIIDDRTQLNSRVIRVFKQKYPLDENPKLEDVVKGEILFYAHVVIKWGIQLNLWYKVGKVKFDEPVNVLFRNPVGLEKVEISNNWRIWYPNQPFNYVGTLTKEYQHAEPGSVKPPIEIITRMRTGKYAYFYPRYE